MKESSKEQAVKERVPQTKEQWAKPEIIDIALYNTDGGTSIGAEGTMHSQWPLVS